MSHAKTDMERSEAKRGTNPKNQMIAASETTPAMMTIGLTGLNRLDAGPAAWVGVLSFKGLMSLK